MVSDQMRPIRFCIVILSLLVLPFCFGRGEQDERRDSISADESSATEPGILIQDYQFQTAGFFSVTEYGSHFDLLPNSPHQGTEHIWMRFSLDTEELSSYRNSAPILQMEVRGPVRVRWNNQTVYPINDTVHTNNWMAADRATRAPVWHALLINVPVPAHLIQSRNIIEIDVESFYLYRGGVRSVRLSPARVALQFGP
ncbi:MAG: hypothetical protein KDK27_08615, partial [Leptospiraceae bacterium]|nr:hypothetical protein [Leptospiraceae bacterium]